MTVLPSVVLALPAVALTLLAFGPQILQQQQQHSGKEDRPSKSGVPSSALLLRDEKHQQQQRLYDHDDVRSSSSRSSSTKAYAHPYYPTSDLDVSWGYLWDDNQNFFTSHGTTTNTNDNNDIPPSVHRIADGLSWSNVVWSVRDGVVLGVYEPVSNLIKMAIHSIFLGGLGLGAKDGDGDGDDDARMYRVVNLCVHLLNVILSVFVMRSFIDGVCGYDDDDDESSAKSSALSAKSSDARQHHRRLATDLGLTLGTAFIAVHPLTVQLIGWPSCLPYELAGFFCLLSFWAFVVAHNNAINNEARRRASAVDWTNGERTVGIVGNGNVYKEEEEEEEADGWKEEGSNGLGGVRQRKGGGGRGRGRGKSKKAPRSSSRSGNGGSSSAEKLPIPKTPDETTPERLVVVVGKMMNPANLISVLCYVAATFCKAPAVVLPAIFLVVEVYCYGGDYSDGVSSGGLPSRRRPPPLPWYAAFLLPHQILTRFACHTFPQLIRRIRRSLSLDAPLTLHFFVAALVVLPVLLSGTHGAVDSVDRLSWLERAVKATRALVWYGGKVVVPTDLVALVEAESFSLVIASSVGDGDGPLSWFRSIQWSNLLPLVGIPYVTVVVLTDSLETTSRRVGACIFGTAVGLLLPTLGLVQHGQKMMVAADRYMYLPLLMLGGPIGAAVTGGWHKVVCGGGGNDENSGKKVKHSKRRRGGKKVRVSILALSVVLPTLFGICTFVTRSVPIELYYWRNSQLLWTRNVNLYPKCGTGHANLAKEYIHYNVNLGKAEVHALAAVNLFHGDYKHTLTLARVYHLQNRHGESKTVLRELTSRQGTSPQNARNGHYLLSHVLLRMGEFDDALEHMARAAAFGDGRARMELPSLEVDLAYLSSQRAKAQS